MRRRESLMEIQVDDVYAHVARACHAHQRVHIRAVHVETSPPA